MPPKGKQSGSAEGGATPAPSPPTVSSSTSSGAEPASAAAAAANGGPPNVVALPAFDAEAAARRIKELATRKGGGLAAKHQFWETQPVQQFTSAPTATTTATEAEPVDEATAAAAASTRRAGDFDFGPLENRALEDVRKEPLAIASTLEWWAPDPTNPTDMQQIYELLRDNYVEDDDSMFRFNYSVEFLMWALTPPGFFPEWHVGVRKKSDKKMLAFISGIPVSVRMGRETKRICEINFLCVHKNLRDKKLSPILIKEVTRRVNLHDIWQAIYTAGVVLPKPFASAQYYHRTLNPPKLVAIGFSRIPSRFERFQKPMDAMIRNYAVNPSTRTAGLREMRPGDVDRVTELLNEYMHGPSTNFMVAPHFDRAEVHHWMLPRPNVVYSYVVEHNGSITDFISFYNLPSTVIGNAKYSELKAAYTYYYACTATPILALMTDALVLAKQQHFDVFNTLDILDNAKFIEELKFGRGDGTLQYYFYNWRFPAVESKHVGLVML